jgi:predicted outer membrane repeat protein
MTSRVNFSKWALVRCSVLASTSLLSSACADLAVEPQLALHTGELGEEPAQVSQLPSVAPQRCASALGLADTSSPTTVVGDGSADSCTEGALRAALGQGGTITFRCGAGTKTIPITETLVVPANVDTVLDGNDAVVLDGGGTTQLLRAEGTDFRANDHVLTVQRLSLINGHAAGTGYQPRDGQRTCAWGYKEGGGGAISTRDVNLHVWGVRFEDNHGPELGPDVAGGAIYMVGAKKLVVANSTFRGNSASNGGAIGLLHVASELYNVAFDGNAATGLLANFANDSGCPTFNHVEQGGAGGLGGAFYSDGFDPGDYFCGVAMSDNSAGDLGGAVFRSAYWGLMSSVAKQSITWEKSSFTRNVSAAGGGGAAYVNNSAFTLRDVTFDENDSGSGDGGAIKGTGVTLRADDVDFTNNTASTGGAFAYWSSGPEGVGSVSNVRSTGNLPNDFVGVYPK